MKLNRRKALIGIGTLTVGSGAALGSGAFTQVNAERTVDVSVAGDSAGFIGLEADPSGDAGSLTTGVVSNSGGASGTLLTIDLSGTGVSASGVNDEATTIIGTVDRSSGNVSDVNTAAFRIVNNSGNQVEVSASIDATMASANAAHEILNLHADSGVNNDNGSTEITDLAASSATSVSLAGSTGSSTEGDTAHVAVEVDTNTGNDNTGDIINNITFTADTV